MINKFTHHKSFARAVAGFTLIETLLAVLILAAAIAGPLTIAAKGLQLALITKDQVIAGFLAQDAVEYMHFVRDTNRLSANADWLAGLDGTANGHTANQSGGQSSCVGGNACYVDPLKDQVTYCGGSVSDCASAYLYYDVANNVYTYTATGNTKTLYVRTVQISLVGSIEADVTVTVQWKDVGGILRSVVLRDNLFNWQ
ncbi:MAG TPA: hypothetical protein VG984_01310 [Candidatus Paceibacterota bacterium]|nr:hypothetical protein [Candidatus Paceibacterota bacterium]